MTDARPVHPAPVWPVVPPSRPASLLPYRCESGRCARGRCSSLDAQGLLDYPQNIRRWWSARSPPGRLRHLGRACTTRSGQVEAPRDIALSGVAGHCLWKLQSACATSSALLHELTVEVRLAKRDQPRRAALGASAPSTEWKCLP